MSLFFQTTKQTAAIKSRMQTLTQEMSTGRHADLMAHMQGDANRLAGLDREISRIDGFAAAASDLTRLLGQQQIHLTAVNDLRVDLAQRFLTVSNGSTENNIAESGQAARAGFTSVVAHMNATIGDRSLFAGTANDGPALAAAEDMLTDIVTAIGGATTAGAIGAAIDTWFDAPGGGFDTIGYIGDTGALPTRQITEGAVVEVEGRADNSAIRDVLKSLAKAAVVDVIGAGLPNDTRSTLIRDAGVNLNGNSADLVNLSARIGGVEARVQDVSAMHASKRTAFSIARNDLTQIDPFETALNLQDVQTQLEIQFSMTARLSGLSLANYI